MFSPLYTEKVLEPAYDNWKRLYEEDAISVHRAHLVGLVERGILDTCTAGSIAAAIDAIESDFHYPEKIPGGMEDLYFVFERELERITGADTAAFLHTARSRNDMDTTVFRMTLRRSMLAFCRRVLELIGTIRGRAERGSSEITVLYTHGQPANVSTMEHYLTAFASDLHEDLDGLVRSLSIIDLSTMGACAITGTGFPLDRTRVAELLGFPGYVCNTYQAISTSHWLTRPAAALEELLGDITRLVADLLHKASCEVGLVVFPDNLVQASSIMPQKRNPVILEHARIQAGLAMGTCASIREMYRNVPYQDVNEAADAPVTMLLAAVSQADSTLALVAEIVANMASDEIAARRIAKIYGVTTTELADTMVREASVGFRTAHACCSAFVRAGNGTDALREAFRSRTGRELPFANDRIDSILSPEHFIAVRRIPGAPAPEGMAAVYGGLDEAGRAMTAMLDGIGFRMESSRVRLGEAWNLLIS